MCLLSFGCPTPCYSWEPSHIVGLGGSWAQTPHLARQIHLPQNLTRALRTRMMTEWKMCSAAPAMAATWSACRRTGWSCRPWHPASMRERWSCGLSSHEESPRPDLVVWLGLLLSLQNLCPHLLSSLFLQTSHQFSEFPGFPLNKSLLACFSQAALLLTTMKADWHILSWL